MGTTVKLGVLSTLALATSVFAGCPYLSAQNDQQAVNADIGGERLLQEDEGRGGGADFSRETIDAIRDDIEAALTDSQDFWPADFGNYGPLFVRYAWHCAGNYRNSDGRGGCDGGRIRFFPEFAWPDNVNLDKSMRLLEPIKLRFGDAISWGDLIILAADVSIVSMGGPSIGFCGGRLDDDSGFASLELGPTPEQEETAPCLVDGACEAPLGPSTVGLIYVNPEGPQGVPDPVLSAPQIREVFGRMGMNDRETVALIGGGHAFGKNHGACPTGPGPDPFDAPEAPWAGTCGEPDSPTFGRAENTYSSGFEGAWTEDPTVWNNAYFRNLLEYDWIQSDSPGGPIQWIPVPKADAATDANPPDIIMLTADLALIFDEVYLPIVEEFAADQAALDVAFADAWYKLVTRDMGPFTRCAGTEVPPPQDFQLPLPEAPEGQPNFELVADEIRSIVTGDPSYPSLFVTLAYRCAATFRGTDLIGGCNGGRIRLAPQREWAINTGLDTVAALLEPVQEQFPEASFADLIVLAGNVALLEGASLPTVSFCEGRVDAAEDDPNADLLSVLEPTREYATVIIGVRDRMRIAGLTVPQAVALEGRPRSTTYTTDLGFSGNYAEDTGVVSNEFFELLISEDWVEVPGSDGAEYQSGDRFISAEDFALVEDPEFNAQVRLYAGDNDLFLNEFGLAWTALMNADRFDGPTGNVCFAETTECTGDCQAFCSSFACPNNFIPIPEAQTTECTGDICTVGQCCESFCSFFACPINFIPVGDAAMIECGSDCSADLCCVSGIDGDAGSGTEEAPEPTVAPTAGGTAAETAGATAADTAADTTAAGTTTEEESEPTGAPSAGQTPPPTSA